jgi:hypothetical protein
MNYETQAQNGFKTFLVTLVVSLVAFSAIYYLVSDSSGNVDIESNSEQAIVQTPNQKVADNSNLQPETQPSVFEEISKKPVSDSAMIAYSNANVLGVADETSESTVPNTGSETFAGTLAALAFFAVALYLLVIGPRKLAIEGFESEMLKKS